MIIDQYQSRDLFQSTPPSREATAFFRLANTPTIDFNPRPPHGRRHLLALDFLEQYAISIHAPLTGGDLISYHHL